MSPKKSGKVDVWVGGRGWAKEKKREEKVRDTRRKQCGVSNKKEYRLTVLSKGVKCMVSITMVQPKKAKKKEHVGVGSM